MKQIILVIALTIPVMLHAQVAGEYVSRPSKKASASQLERKRKPTQLVIPDALAELWNRSNRGDKDAQSHLASLFSDGAWVRQNYTEAVKWYRKVAERGWNHAQYQLGCCNLYGKGIEKDLTEVTLWLKKSADQGNKRAKDTLKEIF